GFAFDGDGDRVLAADRTGAVVDGDELMALAARHLRAADRLPGGGVAVTVMTHYGFHAAMADAGVEVATTHVGDRYVLEGLGRRGERSPGRGRGVGDRLTPRLRPWRRRGATTRMRRSARVRGRGSRSPRLSLFSEVFHVRHRRVCRAPARAGPSPRWPGEARV